MGMDPTVQEQMILEQQGMPPEEIPQDPQEGMMMPPQPSMEDLYSQMPPELMQQLQGAGGDPAAMPPMGMEQMNMIPPDPMLQLEDMRMQAQIGMLSVITKLTGQLSAEPIQFEMKTGTESILRLTQAFKQLEPEAQAGLDPELQFEIESQKLAQEIQMEQARFQLEQARMENEMQIRQMEAQLNAEIKQQEAQVKLETMQQQADLKAQEAELKASVTMQDAQLKQEQTYMGMQQQQESHEQNLELQAEQQIANNAFKQQEMSMKEQQAKQQAKQGKDKKG